MAAFSTMDELAFSTMDELRVENTFFTNEPPRPPMLCRYLSDTAVSYDFRSDVERDLGMYHTEGIYTLGVGIVEDDQSSTRASEEASAARVEDTAAEPGQSDVESDLGIDPPEAIDIHDGILEDDCSSTHASEEAEPVVAAPREEAGAAPPATAAAATGPAGRPFDSADLRLLWVPVYPVVWVSGWPIHQAASDRLAPHGSGAAGSVRASPAAAVQPAAAPRPVAGSSAQEARMRRGAEASAARVADTRRESGPSDDEAREMRYTTIMVRKLPKDYTLALLEQLLDEDFKGSYDFCYLPVNFATKSGLGYAFVNFRAHGDALRAREVLRGGANAALDVLWAKANFQGLDANIKFYRNNPIMHDSVPEDAPRPVLYDHQGQRVPFPRPTKTVRAPRWKHVRSAARA